MLSILPLKYTVDIKHCADSVAGVYPEDRPYDCTTFVGNEVEVRVWLEQSEDSPSAGSQRVCDPWTEGDSATGICR